MKKLEDLLYKVIIKKNFGYKLHRAYLKEGEYIFIKANEITPKDVEIAQNILRTIRINTREDMFLGLTCVALLSSYEKRTKAGIKYSNNEFKNAIIDDNLYFYKSCVNQIINEGIKKGLDFKFFVKPDAKGIDVTYIEFAGIQFSFHNGNTSQVARLAQKRGLRQYGELDWNQNISFQNGAKEIFEFALHLKNTSDLMYINETPLEYAQSLLHAEETKETDIKGKDIKETVDNERQV